MQYLYLKTSDEHRRQVLKTKIDGVIMVVHLGFPPEQCRVLFSRLESPICIQMFDNFAKNLQKVARKKPDYNK